MIAIENKVHLKRYIRVSNNGFNIFSIDIHPTHGGLFLWDVQRTFTGEDVDHKYRVKIIGVDAV